MPRVADVGSRGASRNSPRRRQTRARRKILTSQPNLQAYLASLFGKLSF
jgi:hypothetical protein